MSSVEDINIPVNKIKAISALFSDIGGSRSGQITLEDVECFGLGSLLYDIAREIEDFQKKAYAECDRCEMTKQGAEPAMTKSHKALIVLKNQGFDMPEIRRALLELEDKTVADLAKEIGMGLQSVKKYLDGKRHDLDSQQKIAAVFQVTAEVLFSDTTGVI